MDNEESNGSDDGHFLSDTDDDYNSSDTECANFKGKEGHIFENVNYTSRDSQLGRLSYEEIQKLAAINSNYTGTAGESQRIQPSPEVIMLEKAKEEDRGRHVKQYEGNRKGWLATKSHVVGRQFHHGKSIGPVRKERKPEIPVAHKPKEEEALEKLALEELLREAKWGKERSNEMGTAGWQKPKVPPTNKRFLRNTLISTLPRKKSKKETRDEKRNNDNKDYIDRDNSNDGSDQSNDERKAIVDEEVRQYRKKHSQYYEYQKHHRRQKAEECKKANKAHFSAEKRASREKKKFQSIMRYGVKMGASQEKVRQENKKAIFDKYHGVWVPLGKTYQCPESSSDDSDFSSDEEQRTESYHRDKYKDNYYSDYYPDYTSTYSDFSYRHMAGNYYNASSQSYYKEKNYDRCQKFSDHRYSRGNRYEDDENYYPDNSERTYKFSSDNNYVRRYKNKTSSDDSDYDHNSKHKAKHKKQKHKSDKKVNKSKKKRKKSRKKYISEQYEDKDSGSKKSTNYKKEKSTDCDSA